LADSGRDGRAARPPALGLEPDGNRGVWVIASPGAGIAGGPDRDRRLRQAWAVTHRRGVAGGGPSGSWTGGRWRRPVAGDGGAGMNHPRAKPVS
ncbi:MAG: hypothetical protein M3442_04330, partial [Chloroflexota bacterium]|nr:hypothetical protein [Chloroflexota bacterium]